MPPARMNNISETNGPRKWKNIFGRPEGEKLFYFSLEMGLVHLFRNIIYAKERGVTFIRAACGVFIALVTDRLAH